MSIDPALVAGFDDSGRGGSPLVATKLRPPPARPEQVGRTVLLQRLRTPRPKLTLVSAPPGYGKSTLLADWARELPAGEVAWLSLDEEESAPDRFWSGVVSALRAARPDAFPQTLSALRGPLPVAAVVLPRLLEELQALDGPLLIVLDDYQRVSGPEVHEQLSRVLERLPAGVKMAIGTRADPHLPLGRLRAEGELTTLRAADLEFSHSEADAFLNGRLALGLQPLDVDRLLERTEGWPAGLYLAALSLRGSERPGELVAAFAGDQRFVADYLLSELISRQEPDTLELLLRSSVLDEVSGPLLDHMLERSGSGIVLRELERSNMFLIPLDDQGHWYRYHQLFRELLFAELSMRESERVPELHRRSGEWHARHGHPERAINHFLEAGDGRRAADLVAAHWFEFMEARRLPTLMRWLHALPAELQDYPSVALIQAWIASSFGTPADVEIWLEKAAAGSHDGPLLDGRASLESGIALSRAALSTGDVAAQLAAGRRAVELERDGDPSWRALAMAALGTACYYAGDTAEARDLLAEGTALLDATGHDLSYCVFTGYAALCELEPGGNLERAAELADHAIALARVNHFEEQRRMALAFAASALVKARRGDMETAAAELAQALPQLSGTALTLDLATVLLAVAEVRARRGDVYGARTSLDHAAEVIAECRDPGALLTRLAAARRRLPGKPRTDKERDSLTRRELEVLGCLAGERSAREIADDLYVSFNTVNSHTKAIYRKLGAASRGEAVTRARERGLLA